MAPPPEAQHRLLLCWASGGGVIQGAFQSTCMVTGIVVHVYAYFSVLHATIYSLQSL